MRNIKSKVVLCFCTLFLFTSTFFTQRWNQPYNAVLSYDALGYYYYLPAFFYDDLGKLYKKDSIIEKYHNPFGCNFDDANSKINGNYILKYTSGIALLQIPAFALAHIWASTANYDLDGLSLPYQVCINFWSILFALLGLYILRKVLIKYFEDFAVAWTLIVLCIASNLYNYISFSGNMSHSYLFTLYATILYITDGFYKHPTIKKATLIGLLSGLVVLIRPTEIIVLIIILAWNLSKISERINFFKEHSSKVVAFIIAATLVGSIQLCYWKIYSGYWIYWSYGKEEGFDFLFPHIIDGLFSYKKGWFIYTPVMLLSVIGFLFLYIKQKSLFYSLFLFFIFNLYLVFSWKCWWYGGSFSQRSVVQSYAILSFPLAALFTYLKSHNKIKFITISFVVFCAWLNITMTYQAYTSKGIMENELMSRRYFWKIFGKININKEDKKYIDLRDEMPDELLQNVQTIYFNDFEKDSSFKISNAFSGVKSMELNKEIQETKEIRLPIRQKKDAYYRATVKIFASYMEWDIWKQAQWIIALYKDDVEIRTNSYRMYRILETGKWQEISIDIEANKEAQANLLKIKFWNAGGEKQLQLDDLKVQITEY